MMRLSHYCLHGTHLGFFQGSYSPAALWGRALLLPTGILYFTGLKGLGWRLAGVTRSPKNPNICNRCQAVMDAGRVAEITVLFADLRGFTELTRQKGPQVAREIADGFFRSCTDILVGQDAIVDHFLGDAVMAFFNVPIQREDHVARAVSAATQIQLACLNLKAGLEEGEYLGVGIGISTGVAAVGTVGSANCSDYTAIGDVVNVAARLQGEAAPGEVLVTEEVYQQVQRAFTRAQERTLELKGIKEPVRAYALT